MRVQNNNDYSKLCLMQKILEISNTKYKNSNKIYINCSIFIKGLSMEDIKTKIIGAFEMI